MKTNMFFCIILLAGMNLFGQQGWQYQNSNLTNNQFGALCAINRDTVYVMTDHGKLLKTRNGGTTWIEYNTGFTEPFFDLAFSNSETGFAAGRMGSIIKTTDGGLTWTKLTTGTNQDLFSVFIQNSASIWAVGDSGVVLHSSDNGATWLKNINMTTKRLNSICFHDGNIGYIAGNAGTLFKTTNGGLTWEVMAIVTNKDLYSLTSTPGYTYFLAGFVYDYMFESDEFYRTNDNLSWTNGYINTSIPGLSKLFFQNDSLGFVITSNLTTNGDYFISITKTNDSGQTWTSSFENWNPPGMTGIAYADIIFVTDSIGYALSGDNILKTTDGGSLVGIDHTPGDQASQPKILLYPNPCKDECSVSFLLDHSGMVSLKVFNANGELVENKELGYWKNGENKYTWNTSGFGKGGYYLQIITMNQVFGCKFIHD
jgi:photosystem II stability/assembly factor-like uncharacterized protein